MKMTPFSRLADSLRRVALLCLLLLLVLGVGARAAPTLPGTHPDVEQQIRRRIEHATPGVPLAAGADRLYAIHTLPTFYERRLFLPAWLSGPGPSSSALELVSLIRDARSEGLDPADYHLEVIEVLLARTGSAPTAAVLADLDLLLTDAFLILGAHLVSGRVDPETFDAEWIAARREVDLADALERALKDAGPAVVLRGLLPHHPGYGHLRSALARYRVLASDGEWPTVSAGPTLHPGDSDERVAQIWSRLAITDSPVSRADSESLVYDEHLETAVRRFQARHGLDDDGIIGEKTLAALNVPVDERVRQIELNIERWRWLPQSLGSRYVLVNIPDSRVEVVDNGEKILEMRAAVGKRYRRTPVFSDTIRYLVLNPFWDVPHRLAVEDKLPEIKKDPAYLAKQGFRVYQGWDKDQLEVDPATVDWAQLDRTRFPYRLRQDPGPLNALGRVKFMFPNKFNVYLHDTPGRDVFRRAERDVSSGCIRLERPLELAELLLGDADRWSQADLAEAVAAGKETVVALKQPVPVHLLYWTAWADTDGVTHFRRDLYGRDAALREALAGASASARSHTASD